MFLSTVIPSCMLNSTKNLNSSPYNFSLPYNFVRGRNLILNFTPVRSRTGAPTTAYIDNYMLAKPAIASEPNRINVVIPDNVTTYTITKKICTDYTSGSTWYNTEYTVEITFDVAQGIITFNPISVTPLRGNIPNFIDEAWTIPVLLTISTIL